jgi:eukaryotic-like serine/threonine-protein kinase
VKSPTIEASRWVGRVLRDKWRIDARIARGGVGTVFAATHKNNGNRVAIKVLHPEFARDQDTKSRFLQEGYAANKVNHPGVVRILDDDTTEEGAAFLVMELLEGELLEKRRTSRGGSLPLAEVYDLVDQLLDVLAAAHEKGIVHRDIKPDNLFITSDGRLKVLDFGFAQMKTGVHREQTATGYLLGTPGFMSPEQSVGNRAQVDAKTDIWAVGATLFLLLSGHPVHEGESAAEMLVAAANYAAPSLSTVVSGLPPKLVQIVDRALAFDKAERWPSARAMQTALRGVPGRQAPDPRRSVPDSMPLSDGRTMFDPVQNVEELDGSELVDAQPSWMTGDRTLMAGPGHRIPDAALPSSRPAPLEQLSDDERTVARPSPIDRDAPPPTAAPITPQMMGQPGQQRGATLPPSRPDATVIMDSSPAAVGDATSKMNASWSGDYPAQPPATAPMGGARPFGSGAHPAYPQTPAHDMRISRPDVSPLTPGDMMFVAGPARPFVSTPKPAGSRILVFIGVALLSMIIVIITGLLVIAASD